MNDTMKAYEAARQAVIDGEARNLSKCTMDRRYKALFAAEDALYASPTAVSTLPKDEHE